MNAWLAAIEHSVDELIKVSSAYDSNHFCSYLHEEENVLANLSLLNFLVSDVFQNGPLNKLQLDIVFSIGHLLVQFSGPYYTVRHFRLILKSLKTRIEAEDL